MLNIFPNSSRFKSRFEYGEIRIEQYTSNFRTVCRNEAFNIPLEISWMWGTFSCRMFFQIHNGLQSVLKTVEMASIFFKLPNEREPFYFFFLMWTSRLTISELFSVFSPLTAWIFFQWFFMFCFSFIFIFFKLPWISCMNSHIAYPQSFFVKMPRFCIWNYNSESSNFSYLSILNFTGEFFYWCFLVFSLCLNLLFS